MKRKYKIMLYIGLTVAALITLLPFVWMFATSFKDPGAVFSTPGHWLPVPKGFYNKYLKMPDTAKEKEAISPISMTIRKGANKIGAFPATFQNYRTAWTSLPFDRFFLNSLIVAVIVTAGQVFVASMAAYSFARLRYPGRDKIFLLYLGAIMVPMQVVIIPNFILVTKLGWINTYTALILPVIFSTYCAYGTFMLRQFFLTIPRELEDAALIDGCSRFRIYWEIILPLSKPAIATLATFIFMINWNSFFWPLVVTSSVEMKTLPVGLAAFQGKYTTDWTLLMAASVITLLPVLAVYLFNQRFISKGIVMSGIKG